MQNVISFVIMKVTCIKYEHCIFYFKEEKVQKEKVISKKLQKGKRLY